jgi:UDP-glucose 4-epimerase
LFCNADTVKWLLDWQAELSIEQGIQDALRWGEVRDQILK